MAGTSLRKPLNRNVSFLTWWAVVSSLVLSPARMVWSLLHEGRCALYTLWRHLFAPSKICCGLVYVQHDCWLIIEHTSSLTSHAQSGNGSGAPLQFTQHSLAGTTNSLSPPMCGAEIDCRAASMAVNILLPVPATSALVLDMPAR